MTDGGKKEGNKYNQKCMQFFPADPNLFFSILSFILQIINFLFKLILHSTTTTTTKVPH